VQFPPALLTTTNTGEISRADFGVLGVRIMDRSEYLKRWRQANKEKLVEYTKKWRQANKDKVANNQKKYQQTNKGKAARKRYRSKKHMPGNVNQYVNDILRQLNGSDY
jgi:ribosome modulation factor